MDLVQLTYLAVKVGASDIHLSPGLPPRFRISGDLKKLVNVRQILDSVDASGESDDTLRILDALRQYEELPIVTDSDTDALVSFLNHDQKEFFLKRKSYNFSISTPQTRLRMHYFYSQARVNIIIRLVPLTVGTPDELRIPQSIRDCKTASRGLIVICGTQGQGKSTTLASLMTQMVNESSRHIITIEDPIEFVIAPSDGKGSITQREVGLDTNSFSHALEDVLREDCNVCVVGEVRTEQEMATVLTMAEGGMLVFATIHSSGVVEAVERIVHMFRDQENARYRLSSVLRAAICQQLLKKRDGAGRILAAEVLLHSDSMATSIREGNFLTIKNEFQGRKHEGVISMNDAVKQLKDMKEI